MSRAALFPACGTVNALDTHAPHTTMPDTERKPEDLSFEEAMESLESIVGSLESERLPLEGMVEGYERGVKLLRVCRQRIDAARQRVEIITAELDGKTASLSEFNTASTDADSPPPSAESTTKRAPRRKPEPATEPPAEIRLF